MIKYVCCLAQLLQRLGFVQLRINRFDALLAAIVQPILYGITFLFLTIQQGF